MAFRGHFSGGVTRKEALINANKTSFFLRAFYPHVGPEDRGHFSFLSWFVRDSPYINGLVATFNFVAKLWLPEIVR